MGVGNKSKEITNNMFIFYFCCKKMLFSNCFLILLPKKFRSLNIKGFEMYLSSVLSSGFFVFFLLC